MQIWLYTRCYDTRIAENEVEAIRVVDRCAYPDPVYEVGAEYQFHRAVASIYSNSKSY